jgi:hypothetical protein
VIRKILEFFNNPEREVRQLNTDAASVIEMARQTYREELLGEIARLTRDGVAQVHDLCGDNAECIQREVDRYKTLHRESRRQHKQAGLTAYTLVIIHARSIAFGEAGAPARSAIEQFLAEWPSEHHGEGTLPG